MRKLTPQDPKTPFVVSGIVGGLVFGGLVFGLWGGCVGTVGESGFDAGGPSGACPAGGGGGAVGGGGGRQGAGGRAGGGGAGGVTTAGGLPCDVQAVYQTHCTTCHAAAPVNGAPMPLVTRANLMAASFA